MSEISSIDDLLLGTGNSTQPQTPEHQPELAEDYGHEENVEILPDDRYPANDTTEYEEEEQETEGQIAKPVPDSVDEYGNKAEVENSVVRERLARQAESMKRQHAAEMEAMRQELLAQQNSQMKQPSKEFEYNPDSADSWEIQLKEFVQHTVQNMEQEKQHAAIQAREREAQAEFEGKFRDGMSAFPDYVDTLSKHQVTDPMVYATRGMKNPAAFLYAAAKRAPQELDRIAKIADPYVQIAEMGRLEAGLRQTKPASKAPRPLAKVQEDGTIQHKTEKEPTIEDLIAQADKRKFVRMQQQRNGRR